MQQATRAIKKACPELTVMLDACFDEYTSHGHCGVVVDGDVDNDATLENLQRVALSQARAGADVIAPSGMMDGFVGWLRESLDEEGFEHLPIMAYSAKYASCFYGPFREAAGTASDFGHRKGYQMDPANGHEAIREVSLDVGEGADIIMVKPALAYLDVIARVRDEIELADRRLQRLRRVRDDQGRRGEGLDRSRSCCPRDALVDQARRRRHDPHVSRQRSGSAAQARMIQYKIVETSTVTDEELERIVNEWVETGWAFEGFQFAMRESSKRPSMAFVIFTRELEEEGPN